MFSYMICGYTFHSDISIPELILTNGISPEFTFRLFRSTTNFLEPCNWLSNAYLPNGKVWLALAKLETGYLLRFPEFADFVVAANGRAVCCYARADTPLETVRHLLLNQVIPVVLSHLGKLVLHASACITPQGAIAFIGSTGAGKSTLAASFGLRGFCVFTDDCLLIEEQDGVMMGVPSYPGSRLWPDTISALFAQEPMLQPLAHYTPKKRLLFEQSPHDTHILLRGIYVLDPQKEEDLDDVTITPLAMREAHFEIVKHAFQLDITDRERLRQAFGQHERVAKSVPFFRLTFPHKYALLPAVHRAILKQAIGASYTQHPNYAENIC
jgi:hypothetical protein